jgi:thiamine-phosphate diphosphorylase
MAVVRDARTGLLAAERGASILQLRDPAATARHLEEEAGLLVAGSPVPVLVNSRIDVALATGAAGAHLPEHDLPVREARRLLTRGMLGRSVHSLEAARQAERQGADYVVLGPIFPTSTHPGHPGIGLDTLRTVAAAIAIPVLAIGGIDDARARACRAAGAAGFAAIRYFW